MGKAHGSLSSRFPGPGRSWPIFRSLAAYRLAFLPQDLIAGLTLAAIAIPEQMATSRLAGLPPETGFFAFVAGSLAFAVFGASRFLSCGADSTIAPIFAGGLALLATTSSQEYAALAAALGLMVGVNLVAGGLFRLGWIADLLSIPVTTGFLAGIAVHILLSQLPGVLGLPHFDGTLIPSALYLATHIGEVSLFPSIIGLGVLAIMIISERLSARIPGALIGLAVATGAVIVFGLEDRGVAVLATVPTHWPALSIPRLSIDQLAQLIPLSLLIAVIVMVQTAATTRSFPSDLDQPPDVERDFLGVGAGNVLSGLFGAFPVNASPPRTAIVSETGGRSQLAGLAAAAIVIVTLAFGAGLLAHVPDAALGGVLLFVALKIIRVRQMAAIYRESFAEFMLIIATSAAIVAAPIEQGAGFGIALSLLHGIWSTTRAHVIVFERVPGTSIWWPPIPGHRSDTTPAALVVAFQAPLSFLNAYHFRRDIMAILQNAPEPVRLIVLEASAILEIDFTAAQVLRDLIRHCQEQGIVFAMARLESIRAQEAVIRFKIDEALGPNRLFHSVDEAVRALGAGSNTNFAAPKQSEF
jgi:SulP family sulfate permease